MIHFIGAGPGAADLITVRGDKRVDLKAFRPNDNTATVWMRTDDLLRILREHGTSVELTQL